MGYCKTQEYLHVLTPPGECAKHGKIGPGVCYYCMEEAVQEQRARAEKAEEERDEARDVAVRLAFRQPKLKSNATRREKDAFVTEELRLHDQRKKDSVIALSWRTPEHEEEP